MTTFLTRLAQRQLGEIPTIQPRVPSLYAPAADETTFRSTDEAAYNPVLGVEQEPAGWNEKSGDLEPGNDPNMQLASLVALTALQHPPDRDEHPLIPEPVRPLEAKAPDKPVRLTKNGFEEADIPKRLPVDSTVGHSGDVVPSKEQIEFKASESPAAQLVALSRKTIADFPPRLVEPKASSRGMTSKGRTDLPGQAPPRLPPDYLQDNAKETAEPPVQVTIGRIEVTAVSAPSPPKRPAVPRKPSMSLDDYLAQRQRRER